MSSYLVFIRYNSMTLIKNRYQRAISLRSDWGVTQDESLSPPNIGIIIISITSLLHQTALSLINLVRTQQLHSKRHEHRTRTRRNGHCFVLKENQSKRDSSYVNDALRSRDRTTSVVADVLCTTKMRSSGTLTCTIPNPTTGLLLHFRVFFRTDSALEIAMNDSFPFSFSGCLVRIYSYRFLLRIITMLPYQ